MIGAEVTGWKLDLPPELLHSPELARATMDIAERVAAVANAFAPVDDDRPAGKVGERLKGSYRARQVEINDLPKGADRVGAEVYSNSPEAFYVERGTATQKPQRILTRSAATVAPGQVSAGGPHMDGVSAKDLPGW